MGKLSLTINDNLEKRFRDTVYQRKGYRKGNISEAVEESFELWISQGSEN